MGLGLQVTPGGFQVGRGWSRFRMGEVLPLKLPAALKENPYGLSETVEQWAEGRRGKYQ